MKNEEKVALVERIRQYSGVKDVLLSEDGYLNGSPDRTGIQLDKDSDRWLEINIMRVTPDFISFRISPCQQDKIWKAIMIYWSMKYL